MRRLVVGYLWLEAACVLGFWAWMWNVPGAMEWFVTRGDEGVLRVFAGADVVVLAGLAVASAVIMMRGRGGAGAAVWAHGGAAWYAGAATWGGWWMGKLTPAAMGSMTALMVGALAVAVWQHRHGHGGRA